MERKIILNNAAEGSSMLLSTGYPASQFVYIPWHAFLRIIIKNAMMPDLTPYAGILQNGKWISKTDFIYRIKTSVDSSEAGNRQLLQALYQLHFSMVYKNEKGKLVLQ